MERIIEIICKVLRKNGTAISIVQVKIHFEALFVRYLWPLVWHQYPTLRPGQHCTTLCDYLWGLSPA